MKMIYLFHRDTTARAYCCGQNSADDIDVREGNQVGINLVLLLKKTISGKVVLSNGVAPEGGYTVKVKASGSKGSAEQTVVIPKGEKSADYILFVNPGDKYRVWYETSKNIIRKSYVLQFRRNGKRQ